MANVEKVGNEVSKNVGNAASNVSNNVSNNVGKGSHLDEKIQSNESSRPKHQAVRNNSEKVGNSSQGSSPKEVAKDTFSSVGYNKDVAQDMSPEERKAYEKERAAKNTTDVINKSADVAASSGNGYAKAFGYIHKGLNTATGGKYGDAVGKVASGLNKLAPGSQSLINNAAESGAADKVGDAFAAKSGNASKAGEKAAEKTAEKAGEKAAQEATKKAASNTAKKEAAKKAGESAASSVSSESVDADFTKIFKSPLFWLLGGGFFLILLVIIFTVLAYSEQKRYGTGEFPYVEMKYYEQIKVKDNGEYKLVDMDDYVAGVLAHEVACFSSSMDLLKAQAIIARTYAQYKMAHQGYIVNSANEQTYYSDPKYLKSTSKFYQAAQATAGVVIVTGSEGNYKFRLTEYDALAVGDRCGGKIDTANNKYVLCQKGVEVPIDWTKKQGLTGSWLDTVIKYYHGRGMSQWGAYYLAKEQGYDFKKILNLFYDNPQIVSLYPPEPEGEGTHKVSLKIKSTPDSAKTITKPLPEFFKEHGTTLKAVNDGLLEEVKKAGPGTREGVVTAAIYTVNSLLEYNARLSYYWGGGSGGHGDCSASSTYGFCPGWGTYNPKYGGTHGDVLYKYTGIDCGRYVTWIFHNGGVQIDSSNRGSGQFTDKAHTDRYCANGSYTGKPGDVLVSASGGHAMLILKHISGDTYYVAHASGKSDGIKVNKFTGSSCSYKIVDMSWYYKNEKISNFESKFQKNRKA